MKRRRPETEKEVYSDIERRWQVTAPPKPKTSSSTNAFILVIVFAVLCAAAYLNRARIGALWQQVTGKAPPLWSCPRSRSAKARKSKAGTSSRVIPRTQ